MNVLVDETSLQGIANAIREKNGAEDTYKPSEMPQAILDIQSSGFDVDAYFEQKFNKIYAMCTYGGRNNFNNTFKSSYVDDVTFKPTQNMKPKTAIGMFESCAITNLLQILEDRGVVLDTSECTNFNVWLGSSTITHLPCISFEGIAEGEHTTQPFSNAAHLIYIKKIITRADLVWQTSAFSGCYKLETIAEIEGEIGTSLSMVSCSKLDELTIDNIVNAYADMTGQTAPVLTVHSTVKAKIVADDAKEDTDPTKHFWLRTLTSKNVTLA